MSRKLSVTCVIVATAASVTITTPGFGQLQPPPDGKWLCVIDKAAGILHDPKTNTSVARAVQFDEKHRFILTIQKVMRSPFNRGACKRSLDHWEAILYGDKDFPEESQDYTKPAYDLRMNMGPNCFSSTEAIVKYFDEDRSTRLTSYDFLPWEFNGLPDRWMTFRPSGATGMSFNGSEPLDAGPVVIQGSCERVD